MTGSHTLETSEIIDKFVWNGRKLYFVKLRDEFPTYLELKNLEDTFKLARDRGVLPEWIDSEKVERLQATDDFFVLPCFRGKLFRRLQAMKIKVYGPPIVRECVEECKELPQWNHPIWSNVFEGAKICLASMDPERKRELYEKVSWMTGVVGDVLDYETTHLVCGKSEQTTKYKIAVKNSIELMREDWVTDLWETSKTTMGKFSGLANDAINTYRLRIFEGLEMAVTSIDGTDRNNLIQLVEQHGGKVPGNMSRVRCKYLITDETDGQMYQKAMEWGTVCVVQTKWIRKCVDLGHLIDEKKFHPNYQPELLRSSTPRYGPVIEHSPDVSPILSKPDSQKETIKIELLSIVAKRRALCSTGFSDGSLCGPVIMDANPKRVSKPLKITPLRPKNSDKPSDQYYPFPDKLFAVSLPFKLPLNESTPDDFKPNMAQLAEDFVKCLLKTSYGKMFWNIGKTYLISFFNCTCRTPWIELSANQKFDYWRIRLFLDFEKKSNRVGKKQTIQTEIQLILKRKEHGK